MTPIYLAQLIVPLALIAWVAFGSLGSKVGFGLQVLAVGTSLIALWRIGIWLFPPWWTPYVFMALLLPAIYLGVRRRHGGALMPRGALAWALAGLCGALSVYSSHATVRGLAGASAPEAGVVDLVFPLAGGTFLIANGGNDILINAHQESLASSDPRFKRWRGNGYAVDIVAVDRWGLRASGLMPGDPSAYRVFGMPVHAPCAGTVVLSVDGLPDRVVPEFDHTNLAGNHIVLACDDVQVVMAHFRHGSMVVKAGDAIAAGQRLAAVGNSGGSNEPHLHIHVQRPGSRDAPLSGDPLPARFDGKFLVRGDRVTVPGPL